MKNNKYSGLSPLNENGDIVNNPKQKSDIFNSHFSKKSTVEGHTDVPPKLDKINNISDLSIAVD